MRGRRAVLLLAEAQAHLRKRREHALGRELPEHRPHRRGRVVLGAGAQVRQVAAAVARAQDLFAHAVPRLQDGHARPGRGALCGDGGHEARRAAAEDQNVVFHSLPSQKACISRS